MKRWIVVAATLAALVIVPLGPAVAQDDDAEATIAALQTQVAELEGEGDETPDVPREEDNEDEPEATAEPTSRPVPDGIPEGSERAVVTGHPDGEKITVRFGSGDDERTVRMILSDAPEIEGDNGQPECYAEEARDRLEKMLPEGRPVFLEKDGENEDRDDRLWRHIWFVGRTDREAHLADEILAAEGFVVAREDKSDKRHYETVADAARSAMQDDEGLWDECGGPHEAVTPTPVPPTSTPTFDEIVADHPPLVDVRDLAVRPGDYFGEKLAFSGTVLSIGVAPPGRVFQLGDADEQDYAAQLQVNVVGLDGGTEIVFVGYDGDTAGIFEGSFVTVYGTVVDTQTFDNVVGGAVTQPLVAAELVTIG